MQILKHVINRFIIAFASAALAGCDHGSPEYTHIRNLPYAQWNRYASTLPVEKRLNLHKEIMRSGHNPQMTIVSSFVDRPQETYQSLVRRITAGDNSRYYLPVIFEIDGRGNFTICDQKDRKILQEYLWSIATNAVKTGDRPTFYTC